MKLINYTYSAIPYTVKKFYDAQSKCIDREIVYIIRRRVRFLGIPLTDADKYIKSIEKQDTFGGYKPKINVEKISFTKFDCFAFSFNKDEAEKIAESINNNPEKYVYIGY